MAGLKFSFKEIVFHPCSCLSHVFLHYTFLHCCLRANSSVGFCSSLVSSTLYMNCAASSSALYSAPFILRRLGYTALPGDVASTSPVSADCRTLLIEWLRPARYFSAAGPANHFPPPHASPRIPRTKSALILFASGGRSSGIVMYEAP